MANQFYPSLNTLLQPTDFPDELNFFSDGLEEVFQDLYYKDFQVVKSLHQDSAFYNLSIITYNPLALELPGTGFRLILNPNPNNAAGSLIPIAFSFDWRILKFIRDFKVSNFLGGSKEFYDLLLDITGIEDKDLIRNCIEEFIDNDDSIERITIFISNFNTAHAASPIVVSADNDQIIFLNNLYQALKTTGLSIQNLIYEDYINNSDESIVSDNLGKIFSSSLGIFSKGRVWDILIPQIKVAIRSIVIGLEFPSSIFRQVDPLTNTPLVDPIDGGDVKSILRFDVGQIEYDTKRGFKFTGESNFNFPKSELLRTGLLIEIHNLKLDLSRTSNIPEAIADNRPEDFVGVYAEEVSVTLPKSWQNDSDSPNSSAVIMGRNLLIGTGGISGSLGMEVTNEGDLLHKKIGGMKISLSSFSITFQQNTIIGSTITGKLIIPGFKNAAGTGPAEIDILVGIKSGEFVVTAVFDANFKVKVPGILEYTIHSLSLGKKGDEYFLATSGKIDFMDQGGAIGKLLPDAIDVNNLTIWSDGKIEIQGGSLILQRPISINAGPVKLSITAIHLGTHEQTHGGQLRKYKYFGFDGGVSINPGGVDARGDGIKFYYTVDDDAEGGKPSHKFLRIQSIAIDLIIPGNAKKEDAAVLLSGYLAMKDPVPTPSNPNPKPGTEYAGGITFSFPKIRLEGSAAMRLNPSVPAFIVDIGLDLPTPIPLGPTGLGIYGFRALLGQRYVADKEAIPLPQDANWYQYYKAKIPQSFRQGIQVEKFTQKNGFSVGAGVALSTAADSGKTFSARLFLLLSLPDVLLLQGQAGILKKRIGLNDTNDPPFSALLAVSKKSIEAGLGVNYKLPEESGKILTVGGALELGFFFGNATAWYVNIGMDKPDEKRIQARVLSLFNAYAYLMISSSGIRTGAGASWSFSKSVGPFGVELKAYLDTTGKISFGPVQIGGAISLGGTAAVRISKFKLGVSIAAALAAEAPKPFIVTGSFKVCVDLPWPLKKLGGCFKVELSWTFQKELNTTEAPLLNPATGTRAVNIMSGETFEVYAIDGGLPSAPPDETTLNRYIIPVDSFVDFEFLKGVAPSNQPSVKRFGLPGGQGSKNTELIPPQKGKSRQVEHKYVVNEIKILAWNGTSWVDYKPYEALKPLPDLFPTEEMAKLPYGFWQATEPNKYSKLRILSQNPLSYMNRGGALPTEDLGFPGGFLFCKDKGIQKSCVTFDDAPYSTFIEENLVLHKKLVFRVKNGSGAVETKDNSYNLDKALKVGNESTTEIFFPEPAAQINLKLLSDNEVAVAFYQRVQTGVGISQLPLYDYNKLREVKSSGGLLEYEDNTIDQSGSVDKIAIYSLEDCGDFLLLEDGSPILNESESKILLEQSASGECQNYLFEVCWLNKYDYIFNTTLPSQQEVDVQAKAMTDAISKTLQPIWRPATTYAINIETSDKLNVLSNAYLKNYTFIFKTAGPLGHFHELRDEYKKLKEANQEDSYKLSGLKHYIDYTKSYPNADGNIISAKPLFYASPKLLIFYKYAYVYTMYGGFADYEGLPGIDSSLEIIIKDPAEPNPVPSEPPIVVPPAPVEWKKTINPIIPEDVKVLNNLTRSNFENCSLTSPVEPVAIQTVISPQNLKPLKLYTAIMRASYNSVKAEVHNYVFQTSRYASFSEQIESYKLKDENNVFLKDAIYEVPKEFDPALISKGIAILNGNLAETDPLVINYADSYDRLINGVLKLEAWSPAENTEFNIIREATTQNTLGILVRNPEPFIDPKTPAEVSVNALKMSINNQDCVVTFSKDKSKAFISNTAMAIPAGTLSFRFNNLLYNGHNYESIEEKEVIINLNNNLNN